MASSPGAREAAAGAGGAGRSDGLIPMLGAADQGLRGGRAQRTAAGAPLGCELTPWGLTAGVGAAHIPPLTHRGQACPCPCVPADPPRPFAAARPRAEGALLSGGLADRSPPLHPPCAQFPAQSTDHRGPARSPKCPCGAEVRAPGLPPACQGPPPRPPRWGLRSKLPTLRAPPRAPGPVHHPTALPFPPPRNCDILLVGIADFLPDLVVINCWLHPARVLPNCLQESQLPFQGCLGFLEPLARDPGPCRIALGVQTPLSS